MLDGKDIVKVLVATEMLLVEAACDDEDDFEP